MTGTRTARLEPRVALVGAGPGDPDLLTRKAARLLRTADVVIHDALVSPQVLAIARRARRIYVGKRARRPQVRQAFINLLLVRTASLGKRVVRLKGGDPFVFGRGGEEGLALAAAGIPFEVVPGVSTATAAAGLAFIPVTHRGVASGFVVVSGHDASAYAPVIESLAPASATVVVMMGLGTSADVAARMVARGWASATPAAVVLGASTPQAETRVTTIGALADGFALDEAGRPGTLVIGEVVKLRAVLAPAVGAGAGAAQSRGGCA